MINRIFVLTFFIFITASMKVPTLVASVECSPEYPIVGQSATLTIVDKDALADATVQITYRPNSQIPKIVNIGKTNERGTISWVPELAGICSVSYEKDDLAGFSEVSVRFSKIPWSGIGVMLFAGTILYGGVIVSSYFLFSKNIKTL